MSRSSSSSASSRCVQCDRLRDELALLKLQRPAATGTAAASSASAVASSPPAASIASPPPPPLLYQLQRGAAPRQPSASPTRVMTAAATAPASKPKATSAAAVAKKQVKPPAATSTLPTSSPRAAASVVSSSQTSLEDLDPACLSSAASSCLRCPCCAILQTRLSELTAARDAAELSLQQSQAAVKTHESNVAGWQRSLKSMREQLAAAQSQMAQQHSKPPSALQTELHAARMQLAEQDRMIRSLQEQREVDQRWIARMQEQLSGGAVSSASASSSSAAAASSADGLSSVQREQLKLRMGAERALLKLQQLFPDQQIGVSGSSNGLSSGDVSSSIDSTVPRQ